MTSWHSYPKLWNLGHAAVRELLFDDVVVEEKIDGSQFSFGRFGDEIKCKSKNQEIVLDNPGMFYDAVERVRAIAHTLVSGWTYRGEYLMKPKHNVLAYDRNPHQFIIIFDVNPSEERYLGYEDKAIEAERIGLECVPLLYKGRVNSADELRAFLERTSILGGQKVEGVVVKNYNRFGPDGKALMGKFVSEAFKEKHKADWKEGNPKQGDIILRMINAYRTGARWDKAIIHLRESGELEDSPKDIGKLMKEVYTDTCTECSDEMKEELFKWAWPQIVRGVCRGLPEYYKQKLLEKQFEGKAE